jgi:hypothetical protein
MSTRADAQLCGNPIRAMWPECEVIDYSSHPRSSMERLPNVVQYLLSSVIGKSRYPGELRKRDPLTEVLKYHSTYLVGVACTYMFFICQFWPLLPLAIYLIVVGARHLQVGAVHHMTHANVTGNRSLDDAWGRIISFLLLIENYDSYKPGHLTHHSHQLSTEMDPTVIALRSAGLREGTPFRALRSRMLLSMVSPSYHLRVLAFRIRSYFVGTSIWKKLAVSIHLAALATLAALEPSIFLVVWFVPHVIGYQSVQVVRAVIEHWPEPADTINKLDAHLEKTSAIFCAVALPPRQPHLIGEVFSLIRWTARMAVEISCRYLFVSADGPNHDLHHVNARGDWADHINIRWHTEERLARRGLPPLTETWGFFHTIKLHLEAMSARAPGERT